MPGVIALLLLLFAAPAFAAPEAALTAAQATFESAQEVGAPDAKRARYRQAAEAFRAIHTDGQVVSARLFCNIANAYAFAGDPGEAALWYSRALVLDPDEPRAKAGLATIRAQLPWTAAPNAAHDLGRTLFFWHDGLRFQTRRALFLGAWLLAWLLLALARRRRVRAWAPAVAFVIAFSLLGSLGVSASETHADLAVVRVATQGRTGDGHAYSPSHSAPLPAGTEARVVEARQDWVHLSLPDGTSAWVRSEAVARVVP